MTPRSRRSFLGAVAALGFTPMPSRAAVTHTYAEPRRGVRPRIDVVCPPEPRGAVLLVHGGAFLLGSRQMPSMERCAAALCEEGLVALALDYRLVGRGGGFDASLDDVVVAMDWWRRRAAAHGADPDRLGLMGLSAGAALAAVAAAEGGASAWVGFYGPYDFTRLPGTPLVQAPTRWLLGTDEPAELRRRSPLARCTSSAPALLFHGTRDRLVPIHHSHALVAARASAGLPTELVAVDHRHGFLQRRRHPLAVAAMDRAVGFLSDHVGGPS